MVVVKLGCVFIHNLLSSLYGVVVLGAQPGVLVCGLGLVIRMLVDEQVLDSAGADGTLINVEACGEVAVFPDTDLVQEIQGKVLAIVVQEVVCWSLLPHIEDGHLAWRANKINGVKMRRKRRGGTPPWVTLTSLRKRLIAESCLADVKGVPFVAIERLIYINDVEVLVHPGKLSVQRGPRGRGQLY